MILYNNGCNITKYQQKFLYATCNITALTSYYVYTIGSPKHVSYPIYAVLLSSNLYWCNPLDDWRRKFDVLVVHFCIPFIAICNVIYQPPYWYLSSLAICGSAGIFRKISIYYSDLLEKLHNKEDELEKEGVYFCPVKNDYSWKSVLAHSGIYFFANLFAGLIAYSYTFL